MELGEILFPLALIAFAIIRQFLASAMKTKGEPQPRLPPADAAPEQPSWSTDWGNWPDEVAEAPAKVAEAPAKMAEEMAEAAVEAAPMEELEAPVRSLELLAAELEVDRRAEHRRFHERVEAPAPAARSAPASRLALGDLRRAVILSELLGPPKAGR